MRSSLASKLHLFMRIISFLIAASCLITSGYLFPYNERILFPTKLEIPEGRQPLYMAVGKLTDGASTCTATLIGRRTILTAAHCYDKNNSAYVFIDYFGRAVPVIAGFALSEADNQEDIAVMYLHTPISDIVPLKLQEGDVPAGHQLVLAGYGCKLLEVDGFATRCLGTPTLRENYTASDNFDNDTGAVKNLYITQGDSGGALVDRQTGAIVGVASRYTYRFVDGHMIYVSAYFAPVSKNRRLLPIID